MSVWANLRARFERPERAVRRWFDPGTAQGTLRAVHLLSMTADAMMTVALAGSLFFAVSPNEARSHIALYLVFTMAPFAALSPLVAPFVDRSRKLRRTMVVLSALVRIVVVLAIAANLHSIAVYPLALVALIASKGYLITKSSLVPEVIEDSSPRNLVQVNATLALLASVGGVTGVVLGGLLVKTPHLGPAWALIAEPIPLLYMVAGGLRLARLVDAHNPEQPKHDGAQARARLASRPSGPGYAHTLVSSLLVAVLRGQVGFFAFVIAFTLKGRGAPSWAYGAALVASALGAAASTQVAPRLRRRVSETPIAFGSAAIVAIAAIVAATAHPPLVWAAVVMGVLSLGAGAAKIAFDATVQRGLAEEYYGRTFARYETEFQLAWVIGAVIATFVRTPLLSGEGILALTALVALGAYALSTSALRHAGSSAPPGDSAGSAT